MANAAEKISDLNSYKTGVIVTLLTYTDPKPVICLVI